MKTHMRSTTYHVAHCHHDGHHQDHHLEQPQSVPVHVVQAVRASEVGPSTMGWAHEHTHGVLAQQAGPGPGSER